MGKLLCPQCGTRLGGFNFIRRITCPCGRELTIHLCDSRVDLECWNALCASRRTVRGSRMTGWEVYYPVSTEETEPAAQIVCLAAREGSRTHSETVSSTDHQMACNLESQVSERSEPHGSCAELLQSHSPARDDAAGSCSGTTSRSSCGLPPDRVRNGSLTLPLRRILTSTEEGDKDGLGAGEHRSCNRRERNRMKSLRRKLRRRERWLEQQQVEGSKGNLSSSDEDEGVTGREREGLTCAVCLEVYFSPYMCHPCGHVFCEPCLRILAKNCPSSTRCPLCRTVIAHVFLQTELNETAKTLFPKEYGTRKKNFQKANCVKWPLPSCGKIFQILRGFRRHASYAGTTTRRHFPHGGHQHNALAFEDNTRGWRFDMDMLIIYIYSVNWVISFVIFCFFCYFFLASL